MSTTYISYCDMRALDMGCWVSGGFLFPLSLAFPSFVCLVGGSNSAIVSQFVTREVSVSTSQRSSYTYGQH